LKRQILLNKLKSLRTRIEDWCEINGYDNMGNYVERKNSNKDIVWKRSDWEHVDALHNTILNDNTVIYTKPTLEQLNKIWKKYKLRDDEVDRDWRDFDLNVGPDPTMSAK
jgi:tRNA A58 N-methylase Trm61|tara:strand:+ start:129 stop:458 length:330 start_codon:yes stop_codon:yes gene_type:complete